jgi:hypothetical protein
MKSKILSIFLLTAILSLAMVSATTLTFDKATSSADITTTEGLVSLTFDKQYNDVTDIDADIVISSTIDGLNIDTSAVIYSGLMLGETYTGTLLLTNDETHTILIKPSYCNDGIIDKDELRNEYLTVDVEINNKEGFGEEDNEWYFFDEIEVEVEVDNVYFDDIDDIVVEWCLLNTDDGKCTDVEDEETDFKLKENKDEKVTLMFNVDPDDIDEDVDDYMFYVKIYSDDKDYGEDKLCIESSESISIIKDDFMILGDVEFPENIACGELFTFNADVWNIADDDEEEVTVQIFSQELGLDETLMLDEVSSIDFEKISFEYELSKETKPGVAFFEIRVTDEDGDLYENDNDDESRFRYSTFIEGSCVEKDITPTITATLDSSTPDAIAGKEIIIKTTLRNNGDEETTYALSVFGNSAWSSLSSIDPQSITLNAGESKEVSIILDIDKDAEGDKEFTIKTTYNDQTTEQKVAFSIEKSAMGADKIAEHLRTNWFIYVIVIVNLILIIAIISVIRRMVGTPSTI